MDAEGNKVMAKYRKEIDKLIGGIARAAAKKDGNTAWPLFHQLTEERAMLRESLKHPGNVIREGSIATGFKKAADTSTTKELDRIRLELVEQAIQQVKGLMEKLP